MARQPAGKRPQDLRFAVGELLRYMGRHRLLLFAVAALVTISACANLLGTYMIRPVVNSLAGADISALVRGVAVTALIYSAGVLAAWGYTQTMVNMAQKVLFDIRRDLFAHIQTLPLRFFDTRRHGDVMSYFTNDVDTVSDALNNSFAMVIQSFIQIVGTLAMLFVLNWQLSLLVVVGYAAMFLYIRYSGRRSRAYFTRQQASLGELDGYIEEMVSGQKVVKVFNHEAENQRVFREKERRAAQGGHGRAELCRHHGARGGHYFLYQLRAGSRAGRYHGPAGHDGHRQPCKLPCVRAAGGAAHQPVHPAKQPAFWPRWPAPSASSAPWRSGRRRTRALCAL